MIVEKSNMLDMETFIRKCIHSSIQEFEKTGDVHKKSIEKLIKHVGSLEKLEMSCFKYYINDFGNCSSLKFLSEISIEGILARAIEIAQFVLYKPDIKFAIRVSDGKIEMINTLIDPFFIKRSFSSIIDEKCRASTFPVCISENAFHHLDCMSNEYLPRDPHYFDSYGVTLFYKILAYLKQYDQYANIQFDKEELRITYLKEICAVLELDVTDRDIAHIDFFIKKQKG
jgi:hypothetical protein